MRVFMGVLCNIMAKKGASVRLGRCSAKNLTININGRTIKKQNNTKDKK